MAQPAGGKAGVAKPDHLVRQAAQLEPSRQRGVLKLPPNWLGESKKTLGPANRCQS
jgi:hypothetical protein